MAAIAPSAFAFGKCTKKGRKPGTRNRKVFVWIAGEKEVSTVPLTNTVGAPALGEFVQEIENNRWYKVVGHQPDKIKLLAVLNGTTQTNASTTETNASTTETNASTTETNANTTETNTSTTETTASTTENNESATETPVSVTGAF